MDYSLNHFLRNASFFVHATQEVVSMYKIQLRLFQYRLTESVIHDFIVYFLFCCQCFIFKPLVYKYELKPVHYLQKLEINVTSFQLNTMSTRKTIYTCLQRNKQTSNSIKENPKSASNQMCLKFRTFIMNEILT